MNPEASSYNIDEGRQKDDDDGEDAHQGAVQPRLDDPFGKSLQRDWEELGMWGESSRTEQRKMWIRNGLVQLGRRRNKNSGL